jgi:putative hydrolase of the HAD superfamily
MKRFAGIRAVTFDVGSTLIEPWPSVGHVYAEVAAAHGHGKFSPAELERRFRAAFCRFGGRINTRAEWARIVDDTFAGLLPARASAGFFPELYARFAQAGAWRIFDDVSPTLDALRQRGLKLGVISNWDDRLRPLLASLKLTEPFEAIVVSCEVGASKPAPEIFASAVAQLDLPPASILHVGDHLEMDVLGARAAGLNAVRIERMGRPARDEHVRSLLDLVPLVASGGAIRSHP